MRRTTTMIGLAFVLIALLAPAASAEEADPSRCLGLPPTIVAVEGVPTVGTDGDDVILGTAGDDRIEGGRGNDVICGFGGDDIIDGGRGDDRIHGGRGHDRIDGRIGADEIEGGYGNDVLYGGLGDDTLVGDLGVDQIHGSKGDDLLDGGHGADLLYGGAGEDHLIGGDTDDYLNGGRAADVIEGGSGADELWGRNGPDVLAGGEGVDDLRAGFGLDECKEGETLAGCEIAVVAPGDEGRHVRYLQRALRDHLLYRGPVDGVYPEDPVTRPGQMTAAVYAFHKLHAEPAGDQWTMDDHVSAVWTREDWELLDAFEVAEPKARYEEPDRLEVDAHREVMWLILDGEVAGIFHVSRGNEEVYLYLGEWRIAHTPRGDWDIDRYAYGRLEAGWQYKSWYFEQNYYAVHGFYKVPPYPASHGCVRVTYADADWLTDRLELDWPIHVWDE